MSTIHNVVAELERLTNQLGDAIRDDLEDYGEEDRRELAAALSDLAVELELAQLTLLDSTVEPEDGDS